MDEEAWDTKVIRTSRWNYFLYYLMVLIIILLVGYIKINDLRLERNIFIGAVVFCLLILKSTEVHRITHYYKVTSHGLEKVSGIFIKKHKKINYTSISQLHLTTTPVNRLLGIGTIEIDLFSESDMVEIKNINKPKELIKELSKRMHSR